jgi:hypothetical protein
MKKVILFVFAMLLMAGNAIAQEKEIVKFEETTHDFGTVKEEDGRISHIFKFENLLNIPITIKNVRASCGCTTPNWSKEPIAPNALGEVTVTYNAKGRPGSFQKTVTVTLSNGNEDFTKILYIKGNVTKAEPVPAPEPAQDRTIGAN